LDDLDQDQWSKITWIMVHKRADKSLSKMYLSVCLMPHNPRLSDPDVEHAKGIHPNGQGTQN